MSIHQNAQRPQLHVDKCNAFQSVQPQNTKCRITGSATVFLSTIANKIPTAIFNTVLNIFC